MSAPQEPLLAIGDVIVVPEGDYQVGSGTLRMRVSHVLERPGLDLRERSWVQVMGVEIISGVDGRHRTAIIKVSALLAHPPRRAASREPTSNPSPPSSSGGH